MSKKLYVSSAGVSHKTTKLRVGINNVSRNVVKGYIGVNNVAKQFWPDEPIYVWNRYNADPKYTYSLSYRSPRYYNATWDYNTSGSLAWSGSFDSSTGLITLSDIETYDYDWLIRNTNMTLKYAYIIDYDTKYSLGTSPNEVYGTTASEGTFSNWYMIGLASTNNLMEFNVASVTSSINGYSKGDRIDQVTSKTRSAYPDNGMSGSYWYVYAGTV